MVLVLLLVTTCEVSPRMLFGRVRSCASEASDLERAPSLGRRGDDRVSGGRVKVIARETRWPR